MIRQLSTLASMSLLHTKLITSQLGSTSPTAAITSLNRMHTARATTVFGTNGCTTESCVLILLEMEHVSASSTPWGG
jgi:hypothetical protein